MTFHLKPDSLTIGGKGVSYEDIIASQFYNRDLCEYFITTLEFCNEWLSGKKEFVITTSGSTGVPKKISISREQMICSARATGKALNLAQGSSSLVCLNTGYIAGRMMLVRGFELGMAMTIVEPVSNPLLSFSDEEGFDFVAVVPLQMERMLDDFPLKEKVFGRFKSVIVGGADVSKGLLARIERLPVPVYATYGMTETVSHIALKKLNGLDRQGYFEALEDVELRVDDRKCLVIRAAVTNYEEVVTNDIVELVENRRFRFVGRYDNIINSGGVKVSPEKVDAVVGRVLEEGNIYRRFFTYGLPNEKLGQEVVLFIEGESPLGDKERENLLEALIDGLGTYEIPRAIYYLPVFKETATGKIDKNRSVSEANEVWLRKK